MVELGLRSGSPDGLSCIQVGCSHHAFSDKHHVDGAACGGPAAGGGFPCKAELLKVEWALLPTCPCCDFRAHVEERSVEGPRAAGF